EALPGNFETLHGQEIPVSYPLCPLLLGQLLRESQDTPKPVVLCIGTDRIIGDSLGPLTGSLLEKRAGNTLIVYGTLDATVHACNLSQTLSHIKKKHPHSKIIAVDASLGYGNKVGTVLVRPGSLKPGVGVNKNLPAVGDISITGIAGAQCSQPYLSLQTARLSLIMTMAEQICECILTVCG
ncbi:MAG: spore protease YyaC, partial [Lachnospiraceae bacterium]|nr:spore protease YyaC [Lachnospiraceae bacterium]